MSSNSWNWKVLERNITVSTIQRASFFLKFGYADHALYISPYIAADDTVTYDPLLRGEPAECESMYFRFDFPAKTQLRLEALTQWASENGAGLMGSK